jgi:hypothetical protein
MTKAIIKQTQTLAVVKCSGTTMNETITLGTDLLLSNQTVLSPTVTITQVQWACSPGASDAITITRNGTVVLTLYQNGQFDFGGNGGFADNTGSANDIVITSVGTGQVYLTLRKATGYKSKLEPEFFSVYDNPAVVGS